MSASRRVLLPYCSITRPRCFEHIASCQVVELPRRKVRMSGLGVIKGVVRLCEGKNRGVPRNCQLAV